MALYVVRLYDSGEHGWLDVSRPVEHAEAQSIWNERTGNGTRNAQYRPGGDYYAIFQADTRMTFEAGWIEEEDA